MNFMQYVIRTDFFIQNLCKELMESKLPKWEQALIQDVISRRVEEFQIELCLSSLTDRLGISEPNLVS